MNRIFLILTLLNLTACSSFNPYKEYYRGVENASVLPGYEQVKTDFQIQESCKLDEDTRFLHRHGYALIGQDSFHSFEGSRIPVEALLREHASNISAQIVLIAARCHFSKEEAAALPQPKETRTHDPREGWYSEIYVRFFAKVKSRIGVFFKLDEDETRTNYQSYPGIKVFEVVEDSPACEAGVLPGDIIQEIGQDSIQFPKDIFPLLEKYQGTKQKLKFRRENTIIEKQIDIRKLELLQKVTSKTDGQ
jgi:hypothetical protein